MTHLTTQSMLGPTLGAWVLGAKLGLPDYLFKINRHHTRNEAYLEMESLQIREVWIRWCWRRVRQNTSGVLISVGDIDTG